MGRLNPNIANFLQSNKILKIALKITSLIYRYRQDYFKIMCHLSPYYALLNSLEFPALCRISELTVGIFVNMSDYTDFQIFYQS